MINFIRKSFDRIYNLNDYIKMNEEDKFLIFLGILWNIFCFIWLCFAYGTIMLIGHIVYNILFNNIEYSNTVMILCGIGLPFCMGMLQGYYKDKKDE